jgi:hypothetical protein
MAKGKEEYDKQYNCQRKNEKTTNNIMVKGKRQKDNEHIMTKGQTI